MTLRYGPFEASTTLAAMSRGDTHPSPAQYPTRHDAPPTRQAPIRAHGPSAAGDQAPIASEPNKPLQSRITTPKRWQPNGKTHTVSPKDDETGEAKSQSKTDNTSPIRPQSPAKAVSRRPALHASLTWSTSLIFLLPGPVEPASVPTSPQIHSESQPNLVSSFTRWTQSQVAVNASIE